MSSGLAGMGNGGRSDRRRVQNRLLDKRGRVYRSEVMRMFASGSASDGDDSDGLDFYQHFVLLRTMSLPWRCSLQFLKWSSYA